MDLIHRDVFEDTMVEAKARGLQGRCQGQGQIISDQGHVCLWIPTLLVRLHRSTPYCHSSVLLSPLNFWVRLIIIVNNVLRPDLIEAKAKTAHRRGQGQGSWRPRRRQWVFKAKATKFCPRGVLEVKAITFPIPVDPLVDWFIDLIDWFISWSIKPQQTDKVFGDSWRCVLLYSSYLTTSQPTVIVASQH